MSIDVSKLKLGALPKKEDARNLMFAKYLPRTTALPLVPVSSVHRIKLVPDSPVGSGWPMYENDSIGDCTAVAVGYTTILDSTAASGRTIMPTTKMIADLYWATGEGDTGRACLDVLKYWRTHFVASVKLDAFVEIDPKNHDHVKLAMQLFGSVYTGIALPLSAQAQVEGGVWRTERGADAAAGSWGGHCVSWFDYTTRGGPVGKTWSQSMRATWSFWDHYVEECYAPISSAWFDAQGNAPGGYRLDALLKDLAAVQRG